MQESIHEGHMVFVSDGDEGVGSIRQVLPGGRAELVVYIENAGDFVVPLTAVEDVHFDKVILNCRRLPNGLRKAIGHAHDAEDEQFVSHAAESDEAEPDAEEPDAESESGSVSRTRLDG